MRARHTITKMWLQLTKPNENKITCVDYVNKIIHYNESNWLTWELLFLLLYISVLVHHMTVDL